MSRAIELAKLGFMTTEANPNVGCVIVKNNIIIAEGYHAKIGQEHAEINALANLTQNAKGATAYVTLEPCSHYGKTPPCAHALVNAGIKKVVVAMLDPNPKVNGQGINYLRKHGIETEIGFMRKEAKELNKGFIKRMEISMPYVRLKMAMSLDGKIAMQSGESKWITQTEARSDVQLLRAGSDAIITGINTVLVDNPSLNLRENEFPIKISKDTVKKRLLRVVLDSKCRMPLNSKLLNEPESLIVFCSETSSASKRKQLKEVGVRVKIVKTKEGYLDLTEVLSYLAVQEHCNDVLFETGSRMAGQLLKKRLFDELIIYMAPIIMGSKARNIFDFPIEKMQQKFELNVVNIASVGNDWKITAYPILY